MENDELSNILKGISIQQYKTDVGFRTLVEGVNENLYVIPKYQRKYRWGREQVVSLVWSLIRGLPIPPIYTYRNKYNQLEILDGQQRVISLFFYYIGYYLNKRKKSCINFSELCVDNVSFQEALLQQYALDELHISIEGRDKEEVSVDYAQLPLEVKRRVDYTPITIIEIKIDDEMRKNEILRQIFTNLNRGGSLLSHQEQRNGIYVCSFYDMLREMNKKNKCWRKIWGREDAQEKDMETLLRFCALKRYVSVNKTGKECVFKIENYHGTYVELLDRFSEEVMGYGEQQVEEYRESLLSFLDLYGIEGKKPPITVLESLFVLHEKLDICKKITDDVCNEILRHSAYTQNTRQGTINFKRMNERWKAIYEIWNRINE